MSDTPMTVKRWCGRSAAGTESAAMNPMVEAHGDHDEDTSYVLASDYDALKAELAAANKLIDDEKTGKLISYLNVLAQENKTLRRMSHADRAEKAEAENKALREDAERLDWFERRSADGGCPALVNDDNGHWAVVEDGMQNVPEGDGPQDISTSFWIEADKWRDSVRAAIDRERQK